MAHSRSPHLHRAAYRAMGLDWTYERVELDARALPGWVSSLGPEWLGLSVTMPGKLAALALADTATDRARTVGAANTLVRSPTGWHADCTDVDGIAGALAELGAPVAGRRAALLGAGGTARAAVLALARAGAGELDLLVRDAGRAQPVRELALACGLRCTVRGLDELCPGTAVVVSTVPAEVAARCTPAVLASTGHLLDVLYDPWPTPLAGAVHAAGGRVVGGLSVLLHQACGQVELFTGRPAPRAAMAVALG